MRFIKRMWFLVTLLGPTAVADAPPNVFVGQHDFGRVAVETEQTCALLWTNRLGAAFEPASALVSCECLSVVGYTSRVEPGDVLLWKFRLFPTDPGQFRYLATLEGKHDGPTLTAILTTDVVPATVVPGRAPTSTVALVETEALLAELSSNPQPVVVDVRPRNRFLLMHIPGSFNLPLHELRGRAALRRQRVVLVGDGHDTDMLVSETAGLVARGYQELRVLGGGLQGWRSRGGPIEGTQSRFEEACILGPQELLPLLGRPDWLWLSVADDQPHDVTLPVQFVPVTTCRSEELPAAIASRLALSTPLTGIVVTDSQGRGYRDHAAQLSSWTSLPMFFVEGGTQALGEAIVMEAHGMTRRTLTVTSGAVGPLARSTSTGGSGGCCGRHR